MKYILALFLLALLMLASFKGKPPVPKWPVPLHKISKGETSSARIQLGRILFFDPVLSADSTVSCAGCHSPYTAFSHTDHKLSHGIYDSIGTRNAPALMNLAWSKTFMWDGRAGSLHEQISMPVESATEMGETMEHVIYKLQQSPLYRQLYYAAFKDSNATEEGTISAINDFLLTLVSNHSKYDSVQLHKSVFTEQENKGYNLYRKNCSSCHSEPLFTSGEFANNGLKPDAKLKDYGRMQVTNNLSDQYKFRIPTLRNLEYSYPYMHDGRYKTIREVLNHYTDSIHSSSTLAVQLRKPVILTADEKTDLVAFLLTLSDRHFIFDPDHFYPKNILQQYAVKP